MAVIVHLSGTQKQKSWGSGSVSSDKSLLVTVLNQCTGYGGDLSHDGDGTGVTRQGGGASNSRKGDTPMTVNNATRGWQ